MGFAYLSTLIFRYMLSNNLMYSIFINRTPYKTYNTSPNTVRLFVLKAPFNNHTIYGKFLESCLNVFSHFIKKNQQQS